MQCRFFLLCPTYFVQSHQNHNQSLHVSIGSVRSAKPDARERIDVVPSGPLCTKLPFSPSHSRTTTTNIANSTTIRNQSINQSKQGGSMPNTSSSVPFLLSSSMQSIRSRRPSNVLSSGPLGSGSGLLQQLGSGMVRQLTVSGSVIGGGGAGHGHGGHGGHGGGSHIGSTGSVAAASPVHHVHNGHAAAAASTTPGRYNYVRKCPSLNITFSN